MTRYLLDANVMMQARRLYYHPDYCPGFWDWIKAQHAAGRVFSTEAILAEIRRGSDNLEALLPKGLFLAPPSQIGDKLSALSSWAMGLPCSQARKDQFLGSADYLLIAHAACTGDVVVSHETRSPDNTGKIKIPNGCIGMGVTSLDLWDLLRSTGVKFISEF